MLGHRGLASGAIVAIPQNDVAAFAGTATVTFSQTGALAGTTVHAGTSAIAFGQTGALKGGAAGAGTSSIVFSQSGDFVAGTASGDVSFTGPIPVTFSQTGALAAASLYAGTSVVAFNQTGALSGGLTGTGTTTLVFAQTGAFAARAAFAGTSPVVFGQSGNLIDLNDFVAAGTLQVQADTWTIRSRVEAPVLYVLSQNILTSLPVLAIKPLSVESEDISLRVAENATHPAEVSPSSNFATAPLRVLADEYILRVRA